MVQEMNEKIQQRIQSQYDAFLESKRKFNYIKIKLPRRNFEIEYTTWYTDKWENQGWLYHKLPLARYAKVYMFKAPTYSPPYYTQYKWYEFIKQRKEYKRTKHMVPNYKGRDKAERYVAYDYLSRLAILALIILPVLIPILLWYLSK